MGSTQPQATRRRGGVRMLKQSIVVLTFFFSTLTVFAQTNTPQWEVYGGYQYSRIDTGFIQDQFDLLHAENPAVIPPLNFGTHQNLNGWNFGGQENVNSWFGGVVDVSGTYGTKNIDVTSIEGNMGLPTTGITYLDRTRIHFFTFMAGPQFTMRKSPNFQPFVRVLAGGAFARDSTALLANGVPLSPPGEVPYNDENFAFGGGAGLSLYFTHRAGLRVAVDYIHSYLFGTTQDNFRANAGLVFRFGNK